MATKTEILRRGLIASGYTAVETRSSRECFLRVVEDPRNPGNTLNRYYWLMTGSLRVSSTPKFTDSRGCSDAFIDAVLNKGMMKADRKTVGP